MILIKTISRIIFINRSHKIFPLTPSNLKNPFTVNPIGVNEFLSAVDDDRGGSLLRRGMLLQEEIDASNVELTLRVAFQPDKAKEKLKEALETEAKMNEANAATAGLLFAQQMAHAEAERKVLEAKDLELKIREDNVFYSFHQIFSMSMLHWLVLTCLSDCLIRIRRFWKI